MVLGTLDLQFLAMTWPVPDRELPAGVAARTLSGPSCHHQQIHSAGRAQVGGANGPDERIGIA